jgi:hypothetical protein
METVQQKTRDRLRASFKAPHRAPALTTDIRIRALQSLGMTAAWLHDGAPSVPASRCIAYFKGEAVHPEDESLLTEAAWTVVREAEKVLLEISLKDRGMLTSRRWRAFARRIYDAGAALAAMGGGHE